MSFWRILNRISFYISMAFYIISFWGLLLLSLASKSYNNRLLRWFGYDYSQYYDQYGKEVADSVRNILNVTTFLAGILLFVVIFTCWGICLEFFDNVKELRDMVCDGKIKIKPKGDTITFLSAEPIVYEQTVSTPPPADDARDWVCPGCNKTNEAMFSFCANCGQKKQ